MSTVTDSSSGSLLPGFVRRRYAVKFAVSILVVLLLIAAVGAYGYDQADDAVTQSTESQLVETSELQADSLAQWVESMRVQTATVSAGTPLTEGGAATAYLREEQARMSADILSIHLANGQRGEVVASTVGPLAGRNFGELPGNPAWTTADVETGNSEAEDQVWVSAQSYQSPVHDEAPVIAFASAVPGQDGQYVVVVSRIQSFLGTVKGTDTASETVILNGADQPVLDPDTEFDVGVHTEDVRAARSSGGADFRLGETDVSAYAPVNGTDWNDDDANDWVAVTTVSKRQAFAVRDTVAQNVLLIVGVGLVSLSIAGLILGRQTVTPLTELRDRARSMEQGDLGVDLTTTREDEIGRLYTAFDSMRDSLREQIDEATEARQDAEVAREEAEALNDHLEKKADDYREVMRACANGDLTERMDPESRSEAMTDIAEEFNEMVVAFERTVGELRTFAVDVATASEEVTASAEEVRGASQRVSESVQEISDGAERQNERFQAVSAEMESLSTTTEEIASLSNEVADLAERTAETGREGRRAAEDAIEGMSTVVDDAEAAVAEIETLEAEVENVDELVESIGEIADETNMLALNANIEASRGGGGEGAGEGFAVVANEIKELAVETRSTTEDIETRLRQVQAQTTDAAEVVQSTAETVTDQADTVRQTADALDLIADYTEETSTGVQEISGAGEEQAASTQEVVAMVDEAASISQRTADEAETVAAAAEEQTSAMSEVSESVSDLSGRASRLSEALGHFDVTDRPVEGDSSAMDGLDIDIDIDDREGDDGEDVTSGTNGERPTGETNGDEPEGEQNDEESRPGSDPGPGPGSTEEGGEDFDFGGNTWSG